VSFIDHIFYKLKNHLFITFKPKNTARLFFVILAITLSGKVFANAASWAGFGGANVSDQDVLEVPSGAQVWAGYANTNDTLYPISLSSGGVITFTASVSGSASVRFRLERLPYPDVDPAFNTDSVIVTGTTEATYSIEIPEQGTNIYRSLILYIDNLDTPVTLKNVQVTPYGNDQNGCDFSPQFSGVMQIEAECYSLADGIETESTSDTGGGENVAYVDASDSLTYAVNVPSTGNYRLNYRVASQSGSSPGFRVFVDNQYSDLFSITATGGWQSWQTQQGRVVTLNASIHTFRFEAASAGINLNWFSLTPTNEPADELPSITNADIEVDGVAIDSTKWFHQTKLPNGNSWFNGEIQHYTDRVSNSYVSDGTLKIVARKESFIDQGVTKEYTSARLNSKFAFKYGRVEFRAKMPSGYGTWPAVWMLGKNISESGTYWAGQGFGNTSWPAVGEIDILEHWGKNQGYAQSAMHTTSSHGATQNHGGRNIPTISSEFHTYSMDWNSDRIIFSIDGIEHYRYNPSVKNANTWPYDSEFFLLLNIAIEPFIDSGFIESAMEIDYIRVHDLNNQLIFSDEFDATADNEVVDQISWDVDGDGSVDALSDGVLILRGTFKLTGDDLVSGAISSESGISSEQVIENIANVEQIADIDGNGQVDALSDVLILLRYLFNFTSDDLIDGAVDEAAVRTSASEIESYLESHMP
jgi:beta-glucanase (GH16 family)